MDEIQCWSRPVCRDNVLQWPNGPSAIAPLADCMQRLCSVFEGHSNRETKRATRATVAPSICGFKRVMSNMIRIWSAERTALDSSHPKHQHDTTPAGIRKK